MCTPSWLTTKMQLVADDLTVIPGDVLLCRWLGDNSRYACKKTGYSHVAMCIGDNKILDAQLGGVAIRPLFELLMAYDYVAVLRPHHGSWSPDRLRRLREFGERQIGKGFNSKGIGQIPARKAKVLCMTPQDIGAHLSGFSPLVASERSMYFCSELVASAFIDAGIIDQSAAPIFEPGQTMPFDILVDGAYGLFVGYLPSRQAVPTDDWFYSSV